MRRFVDSDDANEIRACVAQGMASGVVTVPAAVRDIRDLAVGPILVDLAAVGLDALVSEARGLAAVAANVVVRMPATRAGIDAVRACAAERIKTALAVAPTPADALSAAQAGAAYVSVSLGRVDGVEGTEVIRRTAALLRTYDLATEVLAGAIRSPGDIIDAALAGARVVAIPPAVLRQLPAQAAPDTREARG